LRLSGQTAFRKSYGFAQWRAYCFGARRQDEAVRPAHEQIVAQDFSQLAKRIAHRRLRSTQSHAGARDVTLADQCV